MGFDSERAFSPVCSSHISYETYDCRVLSTLLCATKGLPLRGSRDFSQEPFGAFASTMRRRCDREERRELREQKCGRKFCWYKIRYVIRLRNPVCPLPNRFSRYATPSSNSILTNVSRVMDSNASMSHQWLTYKCINETCDGSKVAIFRDILLHICGFYRRFTGIFIKFLTWFINIFIAKNRVIPIFLKHICPEEILELFYQNWPIFIKCFWSTIS